MFIIVFSQFWKQKFKVKVQKGVVSPEVPILGLQMATSHCTLIGSFFSVCYYVSGPSLPFVFFGGGGRILLFCPDQLLIFNPPASVRICSSYKDSGRTGLGSIHMTSFKCNYLFKTSVSEHVVGVLYSQFHFPQSLVVQKY